MKKVIIFAGLLMTCNIVSAQNKLSLGLCETLPNGFYKMELDSLTIQNGEYCKLPPKELDQRIISFKNLEFLDFYSEQPTSLPLEIAQLTNLKSVTTNVPNAALLQMSELKSLTLHSVDKLSLLERVGLEKLVALEELSLSFPDLKETYRIRGVAQLKNLKSVTLSNPNQAIVNEVLSNPNIESLTIKYTSEEVILDFRYTTKLKQLVLQNNYLKEIPSTVVALKNLEVLQISSNELKEISEEIIELISLKELNIGYNNITNIPSYIGKLKNLEKLEISGNNGFNTLPIEIGVLPKFKVLKASNCQLSNVPNEIFNCLLLEELWLDNNELSIVKGDFNNCKNLNTLMLHKNKISRIDPTMFKLPKLEELNLSDNMMEVFPTSFSPLKALQILQIQNNPLKIFPTEIYELLDLEKVLVSGSYKTSKGFRESKNSPMVIFSK